MQIIIINLASQAARWSATSAQFASLGMNPSRHAALPGADLSNAQMTNLYSDPLNRVTYHKPLGNGEIGCYASHLAVWAKLVESGAPAMAVFEDDIEIDADLPDVLNALATSGMAWDIVKLIGRHDEKIRGRAELLSNRHLIWYRRAPSLTGAYVITARGARKLLARRRPFGRPVDVDLRHWWECDLDLRGVYPYPVRGAPSSEISTIRDRGAAPPNASPLKKLRLQAAYTWSNWLACRRQPVITTGDSADEDGSDPPARQTGALPQPTQRHARLARPVRRRNLIIVRAGDSSLHAEWMKGRTRDFDVFVSYYGKTPGRYRGDGEYYEWRPGPKWPCLSALLEEHAHLLGDYEAFWFPDDDLLTDAPLIDRMFAFFCAYRLCLAQPALTHDSYYTWDTLLQDTRCHIRYTRFVEVMAPVFSREALRVCAPTFAESRSGWGLDWVWPGLCSKAGLGRIAILDATPVRHTRPVGGELYANHAGMNPRADAASVLRKHGIEEVRAVAKYSFEGQVRDVSLPAVERFLFWLKRLNGRRKHRVHA